MDHWTADEVLLKEKGDDSALKDMVVEGWDEELGDDGDEMSKGTREKKLSLKKFVLVGSQPRIVILM